VFHCCSFFTCKGNKQKTKYVRLPLCILFASAKKTEIFVSVLKGLRSVKNCLNLFLFRRNVVPLWAETKRTKCVSGLKNGLYVDFVEKVNR